jgi:hypothetical protein
MSTENAIAIWVNEKESEESEETEPCIGCALHFK